MVQNYWAFFNKLFKLLCGNQQSVLEILLNHWKIALYLLPYTGPSAPNQPNNLFDQVSLHCGVNNVRVNVIRTTAINTMTYIL